jgi:hypothetical protein
MANLVKHRFSSGKTDGPDASQVQPSHWNDGHAFTGGAAGDVLTRDPTDATYGAKWVTPAPVVPPVTAIVYDGTITPFIVLPAGSAVLVDVTAVSPTRITIHGITVNVDTKVGTRVTIRVQGSGDILLAHQSASAPSNGAFLNWITSGPTPLACGNLLDGTTSGGGSGASASYVFDGARWRLVAHEQGRPLKVPYNAGSFVGCTIPAGNLSVYDYYIHGTDAHVRAFLVGASVPAPVASIVVAGWPFTFIPGSTVPVPSITSIGGYGFCFTRASSDLTGIKFEKTDFSNWAAGTFDFAFDITVPIR